MRLSRLIVITACHLFFLTVLIVVLQSCDQTTTPRVLVFSKTKGWKHSSIPYGIEAIFKLGKENDFLVDTTKNAEFFDDFNLKQYHAVIFNNTTRNVLNAEQQAAFERYIQAGGGFVGIHSAADTEYEWPWYDKLVGAHFASHPHNPNVRKATVNVTDTSHLSTRGLPAHWERTDEWYNYRSFYPGIKVLAYLDENSYEGGTNGSNHPIAWYQEFDGGRAFYTGGGHQDSSFAEPLFLQHLLGGIRYAMGTGRLDYGKAHAVTVPEENRFVKTVLVNDLDTPMELAVAPDGRVFYTELRGANLSVYDTRTGKNSLVHQFNVATKGGTGLIGVTLDPDFSDNQYIYVYYSPPIDQEPIIFNLSRFTITPDNSLDLNSEKVLLQVPVQQNSGAHHGGSLAWDKDGNLFISTGDSSSPFPSNGYAPLDERPGAEFYSLDAQRSASNTNDLKGKVLRIHPEPDGTYTIPKGNLFEVGTDKTRPEIYAMGCRNPYRIAVNPKSSVLYWGEIGPDAGKDSIQGPRGYDEFNQAKAPGNFGWPYFVGNNSAYYKWDFTTNTAGVLFDPKLPVNNSPNNTGLTNLPPALPAMIWYPYAASEEFPELGQGGRSAMAGEFYTFDSQSTSPNKFPEYYDGALFVFDWMRNWVLALRFDDEENYKSNEPFMASAGDFRRPIDLAFGKDGIMYMLEYGSVYGADNEDARLVKIEYNSGNRSPIAKAGVVDSVGIAELDKKVFLTSERTLLPLKEISGPSPLRVKFTSRGTLDPDDDDSYRIEWLFDGKTMESTLAYPTYTYKVPGNYFAVLRVTDQSGAVGIDTVAVKVGNQVPAVTIVSPNNKSFYWDNRPFKYEVRAVDAEDGKVSSKDIRVSSVYIPEPGIGASESGTASLPYGFSLIANSDCKACHTIDKKSVGPSYTAVAEKYKGQSGAVSLLARKVIAGGGGNWGTEHVMAAHPQIPAQDANEMVKYILSLANSRKEESALPIKGTLVLKSHLDTEPRGIYTLSASYTDKGSNGIGPLTGKDVIVLRNAKVRTVYADAHVGFRRFGNNLSGGNHKSYILLKNIDLTGIRKFTYEYSAKKEGEIEVRMDSQAGPVISSTPYTITTDADSPPVTGALTTPISGRHDIYFVVIKRDKPNDDIINLKSILFEE